MAAMNATNARKKLYKLIKEVGESHEPVTITARDRSAVPGMADSIRRGMKTPVEDCDSRLTW